MFLLEKIIDKLLGIKAKRKISETSGKSIDRWGRTIIVVISLCCLPFVINDDGSLAKWYYVLFFTVLLGYQVILERIYLKNSKQFIGTFIFLIIFVVFIYNIEKFFRITGMW